MSERDLTEPMSQSTSLSTDWADCLRSAKRPTSREMREHLLEVHRQNTGFTEACAWHSRDSSGRNSYEWLVETADPQRHRTIVDLACGSGPLTDLCQRRFGNATRIVGVDMSRHELELARQRVPGEHVEFHEAMAQDMAFLDDDSVDAVLCHWALTLMDPVGPVLAEVHRVLRPGGVFAAIVDGDMRLTPCYEQQHHIIYDWVRREFPHYGAIELGDPRVRTAEALGELVNEYFRGDDIRVEHSFVEMTGEPETLAQQAAGFFYASFVLSPDNRAQMLEALERDFEDRRPQPSAPHSRFRMPINRLVVQRR
jgi:ubiquinone/menaquinone biosynthesis C-methylase UbiE